MEDELDLMGPEELSDPSVSAQRLLTGERCRFYPKFDPPFYIVSRYQDVEKVLRRPDDFLSGHGQGPNFAPPAGVVSDPPEHTFFRRLVQEDFLPRSIATLKPRLVELANGQLDRVQDEPSWDLHDTLAFPLPVSIICEIFGIPTDDIEQFKIWSDAMGAALAAQDPTPYEAQQLRMREYLVDLLRDRRTSEDDRLLARIARARRDDGLVLTDEEAVGLILQLFVAGNETTTSLITNFVWRMLSLELWSEFCRGNIDTQKAINESLRFDPPLLGLFRTTARELRIGETLVPEHTKILTHYGAANRDPDVFERPNEFDPQRPSRSHLSFGLGIHVCLGRELARLEAQVALETLRDRFPELELVDDGERVVPFLFWGRRKLPVRAPH